MKTTGIITCSFWSKNKTTLIFVALSGTNFGQPLNKCYFINRKKGLSRMISLFFYLIISKLFDKGFLFNMLSPITKHPGN